MQVQGRGGRKAEASLPAGCRPSRRLQNQLASRNCPKAAAESKQGTSAIRKKRGTIPPARKRFCAPAIVRQNSCKEKVVDGCPSREENLQGRIRQERGRKRHTYQVLRENHRRRALQITWERGRCRSEPTTAVKKGGGYSSGGSNRKGPPFSHQ